MCPLIVLLLSFHRFLCQWLSSSSSSWSSSLSFTFSFASSSSFPLLFKTGNYWRQQSQQGLTVSATITHRRLLRFAGAAAARRRSSSTTAISFTFSTFCPFMILVALCCCCRTEELCVYQRTEMIVPTRHKDTVVSVWGSCRRRQCSRSRSFSLVSVLFSLWSRFFLFYCHCSID